MPQALLLRARGSQLLGLRFEHLEGLRSWLGDWPREISSAAKKVTWLRPVYGRLLLPECKLLCCVWLMEAAVAAVGCRVCLMPCCWPRR